MTTEQPSINLRAIRDVQPDARLKRERSTTWKIIGGLVFLTFVSPFFGEIGMGIFIAAFVLLVPALAIFAIVTASRTQKRNLAMLQAFALDNNFSFIPDAKWRSDGIIFQVGRRHKIKYMLCGAIRGYPVAIYWLELTTGSGKSQQTHYYGVVEIELPKVLPHIFIDDKRNNFLGTELLNGFRHQALIGLEGDFPQYYQIFAAKDYETEVLTILNPGFMRALVDKTNKEEIELLDDTAFVYCDQVYGPGEADIVRMFGEADFLITQLQKQLDTFRFQVDPKRPNRIKPSWLGRLV